MIHEDRDALHHKHRQQSIMTVPIEYIKVDHEDIGDQVLKTEDIKLESEERIEIIEFDEKSSMSSRFNDQKSSNTINGPETETENDPLLDNAVCLDEIMKEEPMFYDPTQAEHFESLQNVEMDIADGRFGGAKRKIANVRELTRVEGKSRTKLTETKINRDSADQNDQRNHTKTYRFTSSRYVSHQNIPANVRYDRLDHFPCNTTRRRCQATGCNSRSRVKCEKCDVGLCIDPCFKNFHMSRDFQ